MSNKLFRKAALEKLSSPERLDQMIRITSPLGWLSFGAIALIIIVIIIWGFFGTISTTVEANGILTRTGGIYVIQSPSAGIVLSINVKAGDVVKAGEVVARLSKVDVLNKIKVKKEELENLEFSYKEIKKFSNQEVRNKLKIFNTKISNTKTSIKNADNRIIWLKEKLSNRHELYKQKLITKSKYLEALKELNSAELYLEDKKNEMREIVNSKFELLKNKNVDIMNEDQKKKALKLDLELLQIDLILSSQVFSPYEGKIINVNFKEGNNVNQGMPLFSLEKSGKNISSLKAIVYVNPFKAKSVKLGMKVNVIPSHVKREEYGYMLGIVTFVGSYPETPESMMKELENNTLVTSLLSKNAPYKFEITLIPNPNTPSGYKWSTSHGYPFQIKSGTICRSEIVVRQQKPVTFVVPIFKKFLSGGGDKN